MRRRTTGAALAAVSLVLTVLVTGPGAASSSADAAPTYTNPVSKPFADTFADPSLIRGKDGWWYAYGTSDPLREGERHPASHPDRAIARLGALDVRRRRLHRRRPCRPGPTDDAGSGRRTSATSTASTACTTS